MDQQESYAVVKLGARLDRRERGLWKKVEKEAYRGDANHIPTRVPRRMGDETEYLLLYRGDRLVGRAATVLGEGWLSSEDGRERVGFISDFVIHPEHLKGAEMLIEDCLSLLQGKGAEGVIVRSRGFPGLATETFAGLPPSGLPDNPPWYVDLFEAAGFRKEKEWLNFRITLPRQMAESKISRWEGLLAAQGVEVRLLRGRSKKESRQFADLTHDVLDDHYGYTRSKPAESLSFLGLLVSDLVNRFTRFRIYVIYSQSGEMVGFFSWHPDYNMARQCLARYDDKKWYDLLAGLGAVRDVWRALRSSRRAVIGSIGLREEARKVGLIRAMDFSLKVGLREGYEEVDTGPMLMDQSVVIKMARSFTRRHGGSIKETRYCTLQLRF
jgi:hypothetical protein